MISQSTIGELIETLIDYRGKTPAKSETGVPLITAKVIKNGTILMDRREYIPESNYDSWMRRGLPQSGDILVTTEAPLGGDGAGSIMGGWFGGVALEVTPFGG